MADVKVTKAQMFAKVIEMAQAQGEQDVVEFAQHEIELLAKRKSSDSKAKAKKAEADAILADKIVEFLAGVGKAIATLEIATAVGVSTQKAAPILKAMVDGGRVTVTEDKRKKFYALAE